MVGKTIPPPDDCEGRLCFLRGEKKGVAASLDTRYHRSLQELVGASAHLMELTRQRKLPPDATGGSVATVTNFGTFGLAFATPIPLPEQTLVLGMGAARQEPFWDEAKGQFVPVWEALFTLSFDHRVLDGGAAGRLSAVPLRRFRIKVRAKQAATPT